MTAIPYTPGCLDDTPRGKWLRLFFKGTVTVTTEYNGKESIQRLVRDEGTIQYYTFDMFATRPKSTMEPLPMLDLNQFIPQLDLSQFLASAPVPEPIEYTPFVEVPPTASGHVSLIPAFSFDSGTPAEPQLPPDDTPPLTNTFEGAEHTGYFPASVLPTLDGYYETCQRLRSNGNQFNAFSSFTVARGFNIDHSFVELVAWRGLTEAGRKFLAGEG